MQWVIPLGILAAVIGDNFGYGLKRHFGKMLVYIEKAS
jgi:hypothetical protein